ncbi:MAG TPA: long-chain fatty acid--CoA ligase, partial [Methanomicrobia archaeon]|nr:long-chain fatty acid--CoA ligase [Methanomicrobia archaeon]HEX59654.1 long-chain fatty acid--CoA ligase [Methanomicrobia archaeon]
MPDANILGVEGKHLSEVKDEEVNRIWLKHYDEGVRGDIDCPEMPLYTLLENSTRKYPNKTSLDFFGKEVSY